MQLPISAIRILKNAVIVGDRINYQKELVSVCTPFFSTKLDLILEKRIQNVNE